MCGSLRCPADHDGLLAEQSRTSNLESLRWRSPLSSPVPLRCVVGEDPEEGEARVPARCRQSTLESICSEPLEYPCLLLHLSHLYSTVRRSFPLPSSSGKQEKLFLGKPEQMDRDIGWQSSITTLKSMACKRSE
jgi:hypothetical protein